MFTTPVAKRRARRVLAHLAHGASAQSASLDGRVCYEVRAVHQLLHELKASNNSSAAPASLRNVALHVVIVKNDIATAMTLPLRACLAMCSNPLTNSGSIMGLFRRGFISASMVQC
jgi:hypothetical protein